MKYRGLFGVCLLSLHVHLGTHRVYSCGCAQKTADHEHIKWNVTVCVGLLQGFSPSGPKLYFVFPCTQLSYSSGNLQHFYTTHRKWDLLWGEVSKQQNDHTYSLRTGDTEIVLFICICISTDRKWRQARIVLVVAISRKKSPSVCVLKEKLGNKDRPTFLCIFCIKCAKQKQWGCHVCPSKCNVSATTQSASKREI